MIKNIKYSFLIFLLWSGMASAQEDSVYLFSYFKASGDGLHYAWSRDGLTWKPMFHDSLVLRPVVSRDKLFRDPCIVKGGDGNYHMVWTVSWNDRGIGYAYSTDLVNWSEQQFLPVMMHEDSARNTWAPEINYDWRKKTLHGLLGHHYQKTVFLRVIRLRKAGTTTGCIIQPPGILKSSARLNYCTSPGSA